ncbi:integrase core domain-containing protein [Streptomyces sp. NPDC006654]|uniref:integrase core domain-containing protein n=1 Tax=Streptomyces sp. NPDC006654 TaxID=3156897 RepID=UPI0033F5EB69
MDGLIFHVDRGSIYTSAAFGQVCDGIGIRRSMGRVGSSYNNALAEPFWQELKGETMHQRLFSTVRQARLEIFQWLTHYNARWRHSAINSHKSSSNSNSGEHVNSHSQHEPRVHTRGDASTAPVPSQGTICPTGDEPPSTNA